MALRAGRDPQPVAEEESMIDAAITIKQSDFKQKLVTTTIAVRSTKKMQAQKSVRWTDSNLFYAIPPTQSPVSSSSSGSPGPMTPPPVEPAELRLNELLRFKANLGYNLDLSKDPRRGNVLSNDVMNSPMTEPGISFVQVAAHRVPFVIRIGNEGKRITVGDLFYRLHLALRENVPNEVLNRERPEDKKAVMDAFRMRYESLKERNIAESVHEEGEGPRKIDYLRGRRMFAGVEMILSSRGDPPTLRLHVR
ncbi:hypothetical protein D9757_009265 [Collybiopsis confluens]|uniref:DUF6699 domain-containing protein n=1 Tax=Collybiopsis confluens TaxID=2823264 RepID=A0A8H5HAD2_9AGAR|nr:hypothetical protein D9757_009265 [Collybiopsis confluens]